MQDGVLGMNTELVILLLIYTCIYSVGFWSLCTGIKAIWTRRARHRVTGEIVTGSRAVWGGILQVIAAVFGLVVFTCPLLRALGVL